MHVITESFSAHTFLRPLALYLRSQGWHSVIVCSAASYADAHSFAKELRTQGFDVRDVPIPRNIDLVGDLRGVVEVHRVIRGERPALVHSHLGKGGVIGRVAARLAGVPCIHTVYDYAFVEHRGIRRRLYQGIEQVGARLAEQILFVSENERRMSIAARIGRPEQLVNIGFGIDTVGFDPSLATCELVRAVKSRFRIPEGRLVVGTVARLIRRKGIDLLLEAAAVLVGQQLDVHVLVVGGGPMHGELKDLTSKLRLADRVSFTGFVDDQSEMPAMLGAMDVFCLPSRREGYGMVYAEAGAMGKPVVAPAIPPINTIVLHGVTGLLVPAEDSKAIASALAQLLSDRDRRMTMGLAGSDFVRKHCKMHDACARVMTVYEDVLRRGAQHGLNRN